MNSTPCHIGQIRFELDVEAMTQGRAVLERVSVFGRQRLSSLLARLLQEHAQGEALLVLERVELDLGELPEALLERLLEQGIERCLRAQLAHLLPCAAPLPPPQLPPGEAHGAAWQAFCQFIAGAPLPDAHLVLAQLRGAWPGQLARLLRSEGKRQSVRQRLAQQLAPRLLETVLMVLEPGEAPLIAAYVADICALHQEKPLVPENRRGFAAIVWEFVLAYLLLERGSYFNTRALVGHTVRQIARRYRVDYATLLAQMTACLAYQQLPLLQRDGLQAMLLDLASAQGAATPPPAPAHALPPHQRRLDCIASLLQYGAMPVRLGPGAAQGLDALMQQALEQDQDQLLALLRRLGAQHAVRRRLACQLGELQRHALVQALEPVHGAWIGRTVQGIVDVQQQRHVVDDGLQRFGQRLWEFVFAALLQERGSWFNTRSFVRSLLVQLAAHYNHSYQVLLATLIGAGLAPHMRLARKHGLPAILLSLQQELAPAGARQAPPQPAALDRTLRNALLRHMLAARKGTAGLRRLLAEALQERARRGHDTTGLVAALSAQGEGIEQMLLQRDALAGILVDLGDELRRDSAAVPVRAQETRPPAFRRAAREFVLRSFQLARGSYFNNRSYIKQLLHQLAARHGIAYASLLRGLVAEAGGAAVPAQTSLPAILLALKGEAAPRAAPQALASAGAGAAGDACWQFLRHGQVLPAAAPRAGGRDVLNDGLERIDGAELASALRASPQAAAMLERLIRYVSAARLAQLAEALAPGIAGLAASWRLCVLGLSGALRLSSSQQTGLPALAWRALLQVLLRQRGALSAAQFIAAAGAQLAPRLGLARATLDAHLLAIAASRVAMHGRYAVLLDLLAAAGARLDALPASPRLAPPAGMSADLALLAAWLQYGSNGVLALHAGVLESQLWHAIDRALATEAGAARAMLLAASGRQLERQRLARCLPAALRARMLQLLLGRAAPHCAWWLAALARAAGTVAGEGDWEARFVVILLSLCHRHGPAGPTPQHFVACVLAAVQADRSLSQGMIAALRRQLAPGEPALLLLARARREQARRRRQPERTPAAHAAPQAPPAFATAALPEGERYHVDNAGLVILWPFFDHYFSLLGLQREGAFVHQAARLRAAELLHYLCHGQLPADEPALLLNKLLCGIEPGAPVDSGGPLTEAERAASVQLFGALSQAWRALANTDADGVRSTFLCRGGSLEQGEQQWSLTVPRASFDVLMSSLPWALGTIRLSWMNTLLTVHWR